MKTRNQMIKKISVVVFSMIVLATFGLFTAGAYEKEGQQEPVIFPSITPAIMSVVEPVILSGTTPAPLSVKSYENYEPAKTNINKTSVKDNGYVKDAS